MKNLINSLQVQLVLKSLLVNGSVKNIELEVEDNSMFIGEINIKDSSNDLNFDINFNKEEGGKIQASGDHDSLIEVKNLSIKGNKGQKLLIEHLEFHSVGEALELFASIVK